MFINQVSKLLILCGIVIAAIGAITLFSSRFSWFRIGRLPGDLAFERDGFSVYFPLTSMILISGIVSLLMWLVGSFKR